MLQSFTMIIETLQSYLPIIEESLGAISLGCAIILILQPQVIFQEGVASAQSKEISFELILTTLSKIVPLWGLILSVYGLLEKTMTIDGFMEEETARNRKIVFILAVCAEAMSLLLSALF